MKGNPSMRYPDPYRQALCPAGTLGHHLRPKIQDQGSPASRVGEFKEIAEIFSGPRVLCRHQGPAFRASISDVVADAAWQAINSWSCHNKGELQNSVHRLPPQ
jgi:hypothetical protein